MIKLCIYFNDPDWSEEYKDQQAHNLKMDLQDMRVVEDVFFATDQNPPETSKGAGRIIVGKLISLFSFENTASIITSLGERLAGKSVELEIETNGDSLKIVASNTNELKSILKEAEEFIRASKSNS